MNVLYYSTNDGGTNRFSSEATTWKELKKTLTREDLDFEGMSIKVVTDDGINYSLTRDEDSLPTVDYTIIVTPTEHKGNNGITPTKYIKAVQKLNKWSRIVLELSAERVNKSAETNDERVGRLLAEQYKLI